MLPSELLLTLVITTFDDPTVNSYAMGKPEENRLASSAIVIFTVS